MKSDRVIEWGQCDPAGIVFHPRYGEMFDAATAALFEHALSEPKAQFIRRYNIVGIPLVTTETSFHVPCSFGDSVTIESFVAAIGRSSIDVVHRLSRRGVLAVKNRERRVWVARRSDAAHDVGAVAIPSEVAARLAAHQVPGEALLEPVT